MLLHRFMQSPKVDTSIKARSSFAPSKSLSHSSGCLSIPSVGVRMVFFPSGQTDFAVGLADGKVLVCDVVGGSAPVASGVVVCDAPFAVVVAITVTVPACDDDAPAERVYSSQH